MKLTLSLSVTLAVLFGILAPPRYSLCRGSKAAGDDPGRAGRAYAQPEDERGLVALDQSLREITNPFTVLCIAARPGDEDDGSLAYIRKKLGARTVILYATRGEGEDSPTRGELNEELGAVRTREAIAAARVTGTDLFFLNLRDEGFSKSADEPLSAWGHDEALRRMVRAIRLLRADVIITNHSARSSEGVQQAVARLALEAFKAAGDTKLAPEAGSETWQARRFFEATDQAGAEVTVNLDEYDRVRGRTYARIGLAAHQRFASRGADSDRLTPEWETSYYRLVASTPSEKIAPGSGLLDGLTLQENIVRSIGQPRVGDTGVVEAIAGGERLINALQEKLIEKRAEGTVDDLHTRYGAEFVRVVRFTTALERALALALGLRLEVSLSDTLAVPGQKLLVRTVLHNGSARAFPVVFRLPERLPASVRNPTYKESDVIGLGPGSAASQEFEYDIGKDASLTLPQASRLYDEEYYAIGSSLPGAQPAEPFGDRFVVSVDVGLGQVNIRLAAFASFDVAPPIEISTTSFVLVTDWSTPREIEFPVRVSNHTSGALAGALWVVPLALTDEKYEPVHISFARKDQEVSITLKLHLPILKPPLAPDVLIEFRREKPAAPESLGSARIAIKLVEFAVAGTPRVGCVRGVDHWLSFALTQLGVDHSEIKPEEIENIEHGNTATPAREGCGDLARFDTIVIDVNAYLAQPGLVLRNRCLLRYVRQGGNLVVLGQQPDDWNLVLSNTRLAPYPIKLSKARIANESAAVKILDADHLLLSKPNKITSNDFDGWLVDRAVGVPREWSSEYRPLLESSDPGEEPSRGSLLVARYGEGAYIYTSLALRRQLLAGNAGAYRVMANLLSVTRTAKKPFEER
jgi:LmbE family N-acetylglucosaminyl deacetylase